MVRAMLQSRLLCGFFVLTAATAAVPDRSWAQSPPATETLPVEPPASAPAAVEKAAVEQPEQTLAREQARVEQARGALQALRARLEAHGARDAQRAEGDATRRELLRMRLSSDELTAEEADRLYDEIDAALEARRALLRSARRDRRAASEVPSFSSQLELGAEALAGLRPQVEELSAAVAKLEVDAETMRRAEREARRARVVALATEVRTINEQRLELLARLSAPKRRALLGLGRTGIAQLLLEVNDLRIGAEIYLQQRYNQLRGFSLRRADPFEWGSVGSILLKLVALLWAVLFVRRRFGSWLEELRAKTKERNRDLAAAQYLDGWLGFVGGVAFPVGMLIFLYLLFWIVGGRSHQEVELLRALVLAYAWYRVCLAVPHRYITKTVSLRRSKLSPELSDRILRSVRTAVRYGFFVAVILILSSRLLGRGYLYYLVVQFSWLGAIPIFFILLSRWRQGIETSYLNGFPEGRLVDLVKGARGKRRRLWVVAVALVFVFGRTVRLHTQDALSRFKHTRKAFAFVLRRQLERQAESAGRQTVNVDELPAGLRAAFAEGPAEPDRSIERYPHLDELSAHVDAWRSDGVGTAVVLVGETGTGRTSWLDQLDRTEPELITVRAAILERVDSEVELCAVMCEILELPPLKRTEEVIQALRVGPPRFICIDHCENLVLRAVGGMQAYKAFSDIVGRSVPHLFWLCSFSRYAWEYVESTLLTRNVFRQQYRLLPWDADTMQEAIARRMQLAGFTASYRDLVLERAEGSELDNEIMRAEQNYRQLLWDYTEGVPRLVMHFWLRSLVRDGDGAVKVQLFAAPSADELEVLSEQSRLMLAALVIHQNLTVREAAKVLNYPPHVCEMLLGHLRDGGYIEERTAHFRVVSHWYRAVIRYLRRKHLLYS